jgi:glycosyltransferase involved in cell wall biosynthesis
MKLLFVTGAAHLPQSVGGVQSSTDSVIATLTGLGHEGAVACALWGGGSLGLKGRVQMKLRRRTFARDKANGYSTYRAWTPRKSVADIAHAFGADVAVVQHVDTVPIAYQLVDAGIPVVLYFRNAQFDNLVGDLRSLPDHVRYIANSNFTARVYADEFGVSSTIIPPLIRPDRYKTTVTGNRVVMVNPNPMKGLEVGLAVARLCPEIPFTMIQSWGLEPEVEARLAREQRELPNLTLLPATRDMKSVYAQARVVLAPSQWAEAWGRIASEAHVSGIPVLGSDRGGLPEAIGPGGAVVRAEAPAAEWAEVLRRMWADEAHHAALSAAASSFSQREIMRPEYQARQLIAVAEDAQAAFRAAGTR